MMITTPTGIRIRMTGCDRGEVVYTHEEIGTVNISRLKRDLARRQHAPTLVGMDYDNTVWALKQQDLDSRRVSELLSGPREQLEVPLIHCVMPDNTHVLLDGSHRAAAKMIQHDRSVKHVLAWSHVVPLADLAAFMVRCYITYPGEKERPMSPVELLLPAWGGYTDTKGQVRK